MKVQRKKIEIDKWCEGCRSKYDPGNQYIFEWIIKNAVWFRQAWETSLCVMCQLNEECGYNVLKECDRYKKMT